MEDNKRAHIENLATLLVLDEEIRKLANVREFGFFSTNETHRLLSYHTAFLWQSKEFIGTHLVTQSGVAEIDIHAPVNQWILHKINKTRLTLLAKEIHQINHEEETTDNNLVIPEESWPELLPQYLLWCPLLNKTNQVTGGLIFFRDTGFTEAEVKMLRWLISSYQYTWQILTKKQKIPSWKKLKERPYFIGACIALATVLLFPIRISVFGEGTIVPKSPTIINAPLQGVIQSFTVNPGERVKAGQLLLRFDKTDLLASADVSKKNFLLTEAKLRTAINEGFDNKDTRTEIPILRAQLAIDKANYEYESQLITKADITSPTDGIVIFDSKEDWIGQPVKTGERILVVADPNKVELEISLPVANSIALPLGSKGNFFPHGSLTSIPFQITRLGYNAKLMPNKILAYELKADLTDSKNLPQFGTQGTVKIYSHYVPFIYFILRRPLHSLRQFLGM